MMMMMMMCWWWCDSYAMSEWGWNDKEKHTEMTDPHAWYLIAHDENNDGQPVAAVHFRFDIDSDDEVLYWSVHCLTHATYNSDLILLVSEGRMVTLLAWYWIRMLKEV